MRKKIAGILLLIMCVCCGCGKTQNRDVPKESISQEVVKEEEDIVFVPGKVENGSYENASIHLAFDVTEEMYILSEEQIEKVYALGDREMNGEGETKATIPEGVVYDIFVYLPDMLSNVMVQVEDISVTFPGEEVTVKDYADRTIAELLQVAPTYSVSDVTTKKVGNMDYTYYQVDTKIGFVQYCFLNQLGNYIVGIYITEADGSSEDIETLMTSMREI